MLESYGFSIHIGAILRDGQYYRRKREARLAIIPKARAAIPKPKRHRKMNWSKKL